MRETGWSGSWMKLARGFQNNRGWDLVWVVSGRKEIADDRVGIDKLTGIKKKLKKNSGELWWTRVERSWIDGRDNGNPCEDEPFAKR